MATTLGFGETMPGTTTTPPLADSASTLRNPSAEAKFLPRSTAYLDSGNSSSTVESTLNRPVPLSSPVGVKIGASVSNAKRAPAHRLPTRCATGTTCPPGRSVSAIGGPTQLGAAPAANTGLNQGGSP